MLFWSAIYLVVAQVGAIVGFSGMAVASAAIARAMFGLFLVLS
jgi:uncharacterized membrane protein YtjA (UPF0391 family)